jgi:hypothetical protein
MALDTYGHVFDELDGGEQEAIKVLREPRPRLALKTPESRISGSRSVVAHDDPLALDPHDRLPGDNRLRLLGADAEVFEQRAASDAETGDPKGGRGEFASEVVAAAE